MNASYSKFKPTKVLIIEICGFAKRGLPHTSNLLTLTIHNFRVETANTLKFGQQ